MQSACLNYISYKYDYANSYVQELQGISSEYPQVSSVLVKLR